MPRFVNYFLVLFLLFIVFFLGFLTGARWQADRPILVSLPQKTVKQDRLGETVKNNVVQKHSVSEKKEKKSELSDEERQITKALEDPDFKRLHDHLMRQNPIQMNIPSLSSSDSDSKENKPMSKREPIRFSLPE